MSKKWQKWLSIAVISAVILTVAVAVYAVPTQLEGAEALGEYLCEDEGGLFQVMHNDVGGGLIEIVYECENGAWGFSDFWCDLCEPS